MKCRSTRTARLSLETLEDRLALAGDMVVSGIVAPSAVFADTNVSVKYTVRNASSAAATGAWSDAVYLSNDTLLDAGDLLLGRVARSGSLAANASYEAMLTALVPTNAPVGINQLLVVADDGQTLTETSEVNNLRSAIVPVVAHPVLTQLRQTLGNPLTVESVTPISGGLQVKLTSDPTLTYRFQGYVVSDIKLTANVTTTVSLSGSAKVHLALPGLSTLPVNVVFTLAQDVLKAEGQTTVTKFVYGGSQALLTASNASVRVILETALATGTSKQAVTFQAASARLLPSGTTGPLTLTNLQGTLSPNGKLVATGSSLEATVGTILVARVNNLTLTIDPALPNASLISASNGIVTSPLFPGPSATLDRIEVTRDGFTLGSTLLTAANVNVSGVGKVENLRLVVSGLVYKRSQGFSTTGLSATASKATLFSGQATAETLAIKFNSACTIATASVGKMAVSIKSGTTEVIGADALNATMTFGSGAHATTPLLTVASATIRLPRGGVKVSVTATNFRLERTFRFSADFTASALGLPGLAQSGQLALGNFKGSIRQSSNDVFLNLKASATVFGAAVQVEGDAKVTPSGIVGALSMKGQNNGAMPMLGQSLQFDLRGDGLAVFNTTTVGASTTVTTASGARTVSIAANTGRLVVFGTLKLNQFPLVGAFDLTANTGGMKLQGAVALDLKEFGTFTAATDFTVTSAGLRGNFTLSKNVPATPLRFDLKGNFKGESTAGGTTVTLSNGRIELTGLGSNTFTVPIPVTVQIGHRVATNSTPAHFFVAVPTTVAHPWGGPLSVSFSGELRSTGDVALAGTGGFNTEATVKSWLGDFQVMTLGINVSLSINRVGTGALTMTTTANVSASLVGVSVIATSADVSASGLLTGNATFLGFFTVPFSVQL